MEANIRLTAIFSVLVVLALIGTFVYKYMEGWSTVDALYFSTVTMSTGHGYLAPLKTATKIFTVFFVFSMGAVLLVLLTSIANLYFKHGHTRIEKNMQQISDKIQMSNMPWQKNGKFSFKAKKHR